MARTTWRDLAAGPAAAPAAAASAAAEAARAGPQARAAALEQVPGLQSLLAERQRLQDTLDSLTGSGRSASADQQRDERRFPMFEGPRRAGTDTAPQSARERAEARAMDIDRPGPGGRADPNERAQPRSALERAERARAAGADRVRNAAAAWERHRDQLRQVRDRVREPGAVLPDMALPGRSGTDARGGRHGSAAEDPMQRLDRRLAQAGEALRSLEAGTRALSSLDLRRDGAQALARLQRQARQQAEASLRDTDAGRRLSRLTRELPAPDLRALPGEGLRDVQDILDQRRMRALDALRERRDDSPSPRDRPARRTDDSAPSETRPRRQSAD
ncbi:hypothetical protein BurJ1DRAFT_0632 [Burkholderiales bacterium JOSHI_001]|nr:hypothetical protein BurJ1DRAFT_0632 [Burkholderiales bacterium JOSHI_001]